MQSSPFAAREEGKHRARLCPVFLWRLAQSSVRERWRLHQWLRVGSFSSSASKSLSLEAPLFRASVLVHSRSDPHVPLFQLSAIFIHVLAEWGLQSVVTAVVPHCGWVGIAFSLFFHHLTHRESSSVSLCSPGRNLSATAHKPRCCPRLKRRGVNGSPSSLPSLYRDEVDCPLSTSHKTVDGESLRRHTNGSNLSSIRHVEKPFHR